MGKVLPAVRLAGIAFFLLMPLFVLSSPVEALVSQPSPAPTISNIHINRNLITSVDWLVYATYDLPYTSVPTIAADQAYIFHLIDTDGTTELASITPFAYSAFDNGYNLGGVFFYITNASSFVWGTSYFIRISQNPAQFTSPRFWDTMIQSSDYSSLGTSRTDNQAELASNVLAMGEALEMEYALSINEASSGEIVLSFPYGETYFRGACYGIQAMAPSLYMVQVMTTDLTSTNFTLAQANIDQTQLDATWVGGSQNATATQFGNNMVPGIIFVFLPCLGAIIASTLRFKKIEPGLVASSVLLIMGQSMGWLPTALFASIFQAMGIYTGYVWFFARA